MKMKKILGSVVTLAMIITTVSTAFAATPKYQYGFDGELGGAQTAVRVGDTDGLPTGGVNTIPTVDSSITAQYTEGVNGKAIFLDGSYGLILDAKNVGESYSIAFWVKPERFSDYGPIIQIGKDLLEADGKCSWLNITKTSWVGDATPIIWSRSLQADNELGLGAGTVWPWYQTAYFAVSSDNPMALAKKDWTHVVVTVDGSTKGMDPVLGTEVPGTVNSKLYINGELFGEGPVALHTFTEGSQVFIGCNAWDYFTKGAYDDIKVYDTVLTAAEVKTAMNDAAGSAAAASTDVPKTGVGSSALIFGLGALVSGAVALKRKEK